MRSVITRYELERMPSRHSTARVYRAFLNNHIIPKWGDTAIRAGSPARSNCDFVNCPYHQSPRRTCDHSCTGLWSLQCGPACSTSAAIQCL